MKDNRCQTEKRYLLFCPNCKKDVQFFFREAVQATGKPAPQCYSRLRLRVISGVPDPKTGYVTVAVTDCYTSTVTPEALES